jgi:hypothetical protein
MNTDPTERLKHILCQFHHKKIQFINVGPETDHLFICSECLKKYKTFCMANMNDFVSIEEFKTEFLRKFSREMETMKGSLSNQIIHMSNHVKEGTHG